MCDHCAKITSRKGYAGQVTCRCNDAKKSDVVSKEKDFVGCCSKKAREAAGGCCMSGCCKQTKNGKSERDSAGADCSTQMKGTAERCCAENRK
ncbi:PREDICTED: uncharacterized protein LOC108769130 isoform X1 [Trachymyrmex cornetzi]|uniref:uncharacterized protein LOC108769130 isoform X1 n=1 Tax=Trachymyrmex cornetzi TaxID=471704 RepID=UPI00084EEE71|nr:PREDICTED: uncharacterized protein LOC108769130 isoform X1 [Trachymyrmex cornetzi]